MLVRRWAYASGGGLAGAGTGAAHIRRQWEVALRFRAFPTAHSQATERKCVSGRRGAKRSERSEDGTPEARDPAEGRTGEAVSRVPKKTPRAGHARVFLLLTLGHKGA